MAGQASGVRTYSSSGGVSIVADVDGPDDAPVVLLMHGGGQTRHSWSGAMASLVERGYRVVNYDARGHGDSSWAEDGAYALDDRVDDVRAVLGDTTAPFALVGASLGGATAIHAVASGLAASAVVMVDIVPDPEPLGIGRITDFMNGHLDGFADLDEAADAVAAYNPERPRPHESDRADAQSASPRQWTSLLALGPTDPEGPYRAEGHHSAFGRGGGGGGRTAALPSGARSAQRCRQRRRRGVLSGPDVGPGVSSMWRGRAIWSRATATTPSTRG